MPRIPARCDRHVGEAYPPRCNDCDALQPVEPERPPAVGVYSSTECPDHEGYYLPCERCWWADHDMVSTRATAPS